MRYSTHNPVTIHTASATGIPTIVTNATPPRKSHRSAYQNVRIC